jgi:hypothetical protein
LQTLRKNYELIEITKPVDPRNIAALVLQADKAALGTNELGYAGGLRGRPLALASGETVPVPWERYERIVYLNKSKVILEDTFGTDRTASGFSGTRKEDDLLEPLAEKLLRSLSQGHKSFGEILNLFSDKPYRSIATAISMFQQKKRTELDKDGKYQIKEKH